VIRAVPLLAWLDMCDRLFGWRPFRRHFKKSRPVGLEIQKNPGPSRDWLTIHNR
jgi:hypothetical protein